MTDVTPAPIGTISGATGIDSGLKRTATRDNLVAAGQQFESVFTAMMLKSMRQAKLAEPLFDSQAIDTFRDMQDQKLVQQMAEHTPLGIGRAMTDFLARGLSATADENASEEAISRAGPGAPQSGLNQTRAKPPA